jgi:predicted porin
MKKSLIALAVMAASSASFAQSTVSLYGIADVWLGRTTATGSADQIKLDSGGVSGSRFGFKGSEDLGGGLKANFLLEQGFNLDDGTQATAGQMFSRQAYVGFSGGFGEVKLGKSYTAYDDISGMTNAAFDSALSPQNSVWASTGYQANPGNTIYYATPAYSGFSGAVSYSLGENKTTSVDAGSITSVHAKYEGGPIYAGLAYQTEKANGSATSVAFTRLNASYDFGVAKALVGYGRTTDAVYGAAAGVATAGAEVTEWQLGADVPVTSALTVSGGIARSADNVIAGDAVRKGYSLAASYALSKRTSVYTGYQSATKTLAGVDTDSSLLAVGMRHAF